MNTITATIHIEKRYKVVIVISPNKLYLKASLTIYNCVPEAYDTTANDTSL